MNYAKINFNFAVLIFVDYSQDSAFRGYDETAGISVGLLHNAGAKNFQVGFHSPLEYKCACICAISVFDSF